MSDGPYRSLSMRPRWKAAAKAAYHEAFDLKEVTESIAHALVTDYRMEVSGNLLPNVASLLMEASQLALFPGQKIADLDVMQVQCNSPMEASFLGNAKQALGDGQVGPAAIQQALEDTIMERCFTTSRQIEEHMFREASNKRARLVRSRLEKAVQALNVAGLAQYILGNIPAQPHAMVTGHGLDEGVAL